MITQRTKMYLSEILVKNIIFCKLHKKNFLLIFFACFFLYACSSHKVIYKKDKYFITIDPGHGARDSGEVSFGSKIAEKDINLLKAKILMHHINENPHLSAIMTRENDDHIAVDERTAFANMNKADIFISLHTSFIQEQEDNRIAIYYLGISNEENIIRFAVNENHTTVKNMNDLKEIIKDLVNENISEESFKFAKYLKLHISKNVKDYKKDNIDNIQIEKAPLYILIGTEMPAVLINSPYFTDNPKGEEDYFLTEWDILCKGIIKAINSYIKN